MRTWAKRGQTPVLDFNFNYETLSAVAGMTFWNFYFQLFPKSIRSPQVIEFLGHLKRYLRRPVLVIWDQYLWGYWKQHELPNVCPRDYWELDDRARRALKRIRRRPRILTACWQQSHLPLGRTILCEHQ